MLRIFFNICGIMCLECFSISVHNAIGFWLRLRWTIAIFSNIIFTILVLPIQLHGCSFYLLVPRSFLCFFVSKISLWRSFTALVRFIPGYLLLLKKMEYFFNSCLMQFITVIYKPTYVCMQLPENIYQYNKSLLVCRIL